MSESILRQKSYSFSIEVIKAYKRIVSEHKEYVLGKQLLKAGTSIGAMVREAEFAQSKPDFISKLSIGLKEANETAYWISLLSDTEYIPSEIANKLSIEVKELISILVVSIKTLKNEKPSKTKNLRK